MESLSKLLATCAVFLLVGCSQVAPDQTDSLPQEVFVQSLFDAPKDLETLVNRVSAAIYEIGCGEYGGSGWGVTLYVKGEPEDFIVTNHHVVEDCLGGGEVDVWDSNGSFFTAEILVAKHQDDDLDKDLPSIDLALLKADRKRLATLSEISGNPGLGNWVMTMSYPDDYMSSGVLTMTTGVVSADAGWQGWTTDAAINPGSSGGVALNSRGQVIGTIYAGFNQNDINDVAFMQPIANLWLLIAGLNR
jgi:S1-C subfamily serine protease